MSLNVDHLRRTADTLEQAILRLAQIQPSDDATSAEQIIKGLLGA